MTAISTDLPRLVVIPLDEFLQSLTQVFELAVRAGANLFPFERLYKTLARGVVIGIRWSAHAWQHSMNVEFLHVVTARVLRT